MVVASKELKEYFKQIDETVKKEYSIAEKARKKQYDPVDTVEIKLAKNLAERVVGLISVVAPQITESTVVQRILELEKKWSPLDWRVALQIALEVAQQKHCTFKDEKEAIEVGIRVGFAYVTLGVVSSPLEGFTNIEFKDRLDGKGKYFCMNFAGPIRNAGGTMAALSVIIADYVRKHMGYEEYDPTEKEILRCHAELEDYHEYVTNLQYYPSKEESEFLMKHLPIEIGGDASEKYEVSNANLKDLPRVPVNKLRSGYCLIHSSCIPFKAPKLWKNLSKWYEEMGMEQWLFLKDFVELQKEIRSKGKKSSNSEKLMPDYNYIKDLVAGRPVFGHPLRSGAFRLRYGRSRTSGYSAMSIHPATMQVLKGFLAGATHMKVERPSKGAALTACQTIDGPTIKTKKGDVIYLATEEEAKKIKNEIKEILYIGDLLVSYGDFLDRAHPLIPAGYCPEYWNEELKKAIKEQYNNEKEFCEKNNINQKELNEIIKNPLIKKPSYDLAKKLSEKLGIPMHPDYIYYYSQIKPNELQLLMKWLMHPTTKISYHKIELSLEVKNNQKRALEIIGLPHKVENNKIIIEGEKANSLYDTLQLNNPEESYKKTTLYNNDDTLEIINNISPYKIRDKAGVFIGARMGRPEKAKMRKMTGSPHCLFPVGKQGGRLRSFQSAIQEGYVKADFSIYWCEHCNQETVYARCHRCDKPAIKKYYHPEKGLVDYENKEEKTTPSSTRKIPIREYIDSALKKLGTNIMPDLIKGVRGTMNKEHHPEHLVKGILRAKYDLAVNKDGTTRYDASEVTLTHFKPREVGAEIERLKKLGYTHDIEGKPLENEDQILELKVQDIVIPESSASPDEGSADVLFRTAMFIDELLVKLYGLKPYYNLLTKQDLIGQLVIGLAPHTSAGIIGRIIGFSKTQAFLAHPLFHAAMRRDCDGDESCFFLCMDAFLNFSKKYLPESRGSTMDAPLVLTTNLDPAEVDDMAFNVDVAWHYPLEFYEATQEYKMPWEVKIPVVKDYLGTEKQYESYGFTHDNIDFNSGVLCSSYKLLPSMKEKLDKQMKLAEELRAVDENDVARLVIEKHFIRDTKGNLRKFSLQQFRCVNCNAKFRRPPLIGVCTECGGKIIFTISEGSVIKYLDYSMELAEKYDVGSYLKQTLELTKLRIESYFGKEKEKQTGLGEFLN